MNVALLSAWHVHAEGYGKFINSQPDAKMTVVWDDDEQRGKAMAEKLGCEYEKCLTKCWQGATWTRCSAAPPPPSIRIS